MRSADARRHPDDLCGVGQARTITDQQGQIAGLGMGLYKQRLMNASIDVAVGSVELASLRAAKRALARTTRRCVKKAGLAGAARTMRGWLSSS